MSDSNGSGIRVERNGLVTTFVLSRPGRRNAVDRDTALALDDAVAAFDDDDDARVGVLWGEHGTFCAGADLQEIAAGRPNRLEPDGSGPMGPSRRVTRKPVIAAIAGHAVAGGLELALWCDLRVAEQDAVLGVFCRRWGVPLIDGGSARLPRVVGLGRALDLVLTGRAVHADEALRIGLVDRVVPSGTAREEAEMLAARIAAFPQACMLADRASVYRSFDLPLDAAMREEFRTGLDAVAAEGVTGAQRFASGAGRGGSDA